MKTAAGVLTLVLALLFLSCGGGGSSTTTTTTTTTTTQSTAGAAQGVYLGSTSSGWSFESIVLPNDKFYAIYGAQSSSSFLIYGLVTGQGHSNANTYSGNVSDYYYTGATYTGTLTGNFVAGSSINGTVADTGATLTFSGTAPATSDFNYNTPASPSAVTGSWAGSSLDGSSGTVTVSTGGNISGSLSGCSLSGTVTPDTQKNFYNVSITFGGSPCLAPNQTATGIAVVYQISGTTTHQLLAAGTTSAGGTVFAAIR